MNAQSPAQQKVLDFFRFWENSDVEGALALVTPDAVFQADPKTQPISGHDALRALWSGYMKGMTSYIVDAVNMLGSDCIVFYERVERAELPDGRTMTLPIIGVFDFNEAGLITAWRDYWDPSMVPSLTA